MNRIMKCEKHGDELVWEEGGPTMPTIRGRWYCPSCQIEFFKIMDQIEARREVPLAQDELPYDPCHGDPRAGWTGANGVWEPCPVCDSSGSS